MQTHTQALITHAQDQSTQAMTEVALALSMAFFSLLLLALVSIGVPDSQFSIENTHKESAQEKILEAVPEFVLRESIDLTKERSENSRKGTSQEKNSNQDTQYVFYYKSKLYNKNLQHTHISKLSSTQKTVVAMPMDTDVAQALELQQRFSEFNVTLTIMDKDWLAAFSSHETL
ncbi:MAG: hypothetical protein ACI9O6_001324 [Glaciecola sp.]